MTLQIETIALQGILEQFKLNTRLFNNVIEEITEDNSNTQLGENTNSVKWIAGHLLNTRFNIGSVLGMEDKDPNDDMFGHGKGIDPNVDYPPIGKLKKQWNEFSPRLIRKLENTTEADLKKPAPFKLPIEDNTMLGAISFFAHHEAYHIGQLGLLRKHMGFGPMKYS